MAKKTYGQLVNEQIERNLIDIVDDVDLTEYRNAMLATTLDDLYNTAHQARKSYNYINKNFYIVLLFKKERLGGAIRKYIFARLSCPTPTYNQSVWKYNYKDDKLIYLFTLPSQFLYQEIVRDPHKYLQEKDSRDMATFVMNDYKGYLLDEVKKENGEDKVDNMVIKINKQEAS